MYLFKKKSIHAYWHPICENQNKLKIAFHHSLLLEILWSEQASLTSLNEPRCYRPLKNKVDTYAEFPVPTEKKKTMTVETDY